jgi:deoxyribodipyrimidine photo-lyase
MKPLFDTGLMWFRRDLRVQDNATLHLALNSCRQVHCVFVFDREILDALPRIDRRVEFIRESLIQLDQALRQLSGQGQAGLILHHAVASDDIPRLATQLGAQAVFAGRDYEPLTIARDARVNAALARLGISLQTCKDQVIFEGREILTQSGTPYGVFTPYKNNWLSRVTTAHLGDHDVRSVANRLAARSTNYQAPVPTLQSIGFAQSNLATLKIPTGTDGGLQLFDDFFGRMDNYHATRDFPAIKGPSYLGYTCALAPCRYANWWRPPGNVNSRVIQVQRYGSAN